MSGKWMIGMAVGAAVGMYVASKNNDVRKAVTDAETALMDKLARSKPETVQSGDMQ